MMTEADEKSALERAAVREFVAAYNATQSGGPIEIIEFGDAPDVTVRIADQTFGIEVGHIYGTSFDAKNTLGRAGDIRSMERGGVEWNAHVLNATIPIPDRILQRLMIYP